MDSVRDQLGGAVCGIFCGFARVVGNTEHDEPVPFACSIGRNPVFENTEKTAEPWLLAPFERDFYGSEIRLLFLGYIRPEANFPSLDALIARIKRDGEVAEAFLRHPALAARRGDSFLLGGPGS